MISGEIRTSHAEIGGPLVEVLAKDFGDHLVHGELGEPGRLTPFRMNAPTLQVKRAIGAAAGQKQNQDRPGILYCYALASSVREIGGVRICEPTRTGMLYGPEGTSKVGEIALQIARLTVGDVMRLVIAQHAANAKGGIIRHACAPCEHCGTPIGVIDVKINEDAPLRVVRPQVSAEARPRAWVCLHNPIEMADGRLVRSVLVAPPTWHSTIWHATQKQFAEPVSLVAILHAGAIVDTDLEGVRTVSVQDLEYSLTSEDADLLDEAMELIAPAPVFRVGVTCPNPDCGEINEAPINWLDLSFLRRASAG